MSLAQLRYFVAVAEEEQLREPGRAMLLRARQVLADVDEMTRDVRAREGEPLGATPTRPRP